MSRVLFFLDPSSILPYKGKLIVSLSSWVIKISSRPVVLIANYIEIYASAVNYYKDNDLKFLTSIVR